MQPSMDNIRRAYRQDGTYSNARIYLEDGSEFFVHKCLVSRISDFLKTLFKYHHEWVEYTLLGIEPEPFEKMLDWAYGHRIHLTITSAFKLLVLADFLLCPNLVKSITDLIKKGVHDRNIFIVHSLCIQYKTEHLQNWCKQYILSNISTITKRSVFRNLPQETLQIILFEMSSGEKKNNSKSWRALAAWIDYDRKNRVEFLQDLMFSAGVQQLEDKFEKEVIPFLKRWKFRRSKICQIVESVLSSSSTPPNLCSGANVIEISLLPMKGPNKLECLSAFINLYL
jgi:hypothetical protein